MRRRVLPGEHRLHAAALQLSGLGDVQQGARIAIRDQQESPRRTGWRTAPLLPVLKSARRDPQQLGKSLLR